MLKRILRYLLFLVLGFILLVLLVLFVPAVWRHWVTYPRLEKQVIELLKRARLDKNSILSIYAGMIFFMLTSLSIALRDLGWVLRSEIVSLIIFLVGTAFVFVGTLFAYLEVRISYRVIQLEVGEE